MAMDRFIYWQEQRPTKEAVEQALHDYVGKGLGHVMWESDQSRWYVLLNGNSSHPLQTIAPNTGAHVTMRDERWFEVCWGERNIDIISRAQDPITMAIADGFQDFCVRHWAARLERG